MDEETLKPSSNFYDRFLFFVNVTNPLTLRYSNAEVREAQRIVFLGNTGNDEKYQHYKKLVESATHPVTGDIIPHAFRVSAIAPVNIPIVFAMIACPASNVAGTLFLHWVNQSYNTVCNYYNRSGSEQSSAQMMKAYGLAVTSACTFAYGLGKVVSKGPKSIQRFGILIPCIATAIASSSNLAFTRFDEILNGVTLRDATGQEIGASKSAGMQVVAQTAMSRCVLVPCACLLLPPAAMEALKRARMLPKSSLGLVVIEISIIYLSLQMAMPAALAIFPQTAVFETKQLEPEFHNLVNAKGQRIRYAYVNKGL